MQYMWFRRWDPVASCTLGKAPYQLSYIPRFPQSPGPSNLWPTMLPIFCIPQILFILKCSLYRVAYKYAITVS